MSREVFRIWDFPISSTACFLHTCIRTWHLPCSSFIASKWSTTVPLEMRNASLLHVGGQDEYILHIPLKGKLY
jgi:hypothetical protein